MYAARERIARAMLAKDYPGDVGGEMEELWWDRHGHIYLAYADAAIETAHIDVYGVASLVAAEVTGLRLLTDGLDGRLSDEEWSELHGSIQEIVLRALSK